MPHFDYYRPMRTISKIIVFVLSTIALSGCLLQKTYRNSSEPIQTVAFVDIHQYIGKWYEIYRLPNWFEDQDCQIVTAEYSLRDDGHIKVVNTCQRKNKVSQATAIAKVADSQTNAKLRVSFFQPFYGDYWILDLAKDYSWALVGEPTGKYFWILARTPQIDPALENKLIEKAENLGYKKVDLIKPLNQ